RPVGRARRPPQPPPATRPRKEQNVSEIGPGGALVWIVQKKARPVKAPGRWGVSGAGSTPRASPVFLLRLVPKATRPTRGPAGLDQVPRRGFEPPRPCERYHLKVVRLPVPPPGHRIGPDRTDLGAGSIGADPCGCRVAAALVEGAAGPTLPPADLRGGRPRWETPA